VNFYKVYANGSNPIIGDDYTNAGGVAVKFYPAIKREHIFLRDVLIKGRVSFFQSPVLDCANAKNGRRMTRMKVRF
jgi:hypothetical protein